MNFVLFHYGTSFPSHIKFCIKQIQKTNPTNKIYLITSLNIEPNDIVEIVNTNTLEVPDIGLYYLNDPSGYLFRNAALRLFYIEAFILKYNITDVIHFDNDVLIYEDINPLKGIFKNFKFMMTPHFKTEYTFGFSYIKDCNAINAINKPLLELLLLGEHELRKMVGSMPHEMRLLNYVNTINNNKLIDMLPILPVGLGSDNFELFNVCFDPSTYGKHVGGSHEHQSNHIYYVKTKEWTGTEKHHYIGDAIINNNLKIKFVNKHPVIVYNGEHKLINLHIHSKDLEKWTT